MERTRRLDLTYRAAGLVGRGLFRALDVDLRTEGVEHLRRPGPVIIAATHNSYLDMVPLGLAARSAGRFPRFMARHDVWRPGLAGFMEAMGHIPVDRDAPAGAYLQARTLLQAGETVALFPEAGISYSHTVRALMTGAAALGRETGAPIVPVVQWGAQRIYSVGRPEGGVLGGKEPGPDLTRGRRIDVLVLPAMNVRSDADIEAVTVELGHRLTAGLESLQRAPHHVPRPGEHATWYPAHLGGQAPTRAEAAAWDVSPASAVPPSWGPQRVS